MSAFLLYFSFPPVCFLLLCPFLAFFSCVFFFSLCVACISLAAPKDLSKEKRKMISSEARRKAGRQTGKEGSVGHADTNDVSRPGLLGPIGKIVSPATFGEASHGMSHERQTRPPPPPPLTHVTQTTSPPNSCYTNDVPQFHRITITHDDEVFR